MRALRGGWRERGMGMRMGSGGNQSGNEIGLKRKNNIFKQMLVKCKCKS